MAEKERNDDNTGKSEGKPGHGKRILLRTFGCQMNARDSELAVAALIGAGCRIAESAEKADVVVFNSCSVRKHAEDKLFSNIAALAKLKKKRPALVVALMGCTAQNYGDKIFKKAPLVDIVCGPGNEHELPGLIEDFAKHRSHIVAVDKVDKKRPEALSDYRRPGKTQLVSIGEGCDNFCSYCIVPYVRGRERYRDAKDIIAEVRRLVSQGHKDIMLLGQNVNSYVPTTNDRRPTASFIRLLKMVNDVKGIEHIRFMTSHPKDASIELFKTMASLDKVVKHLHLPLQSGSEKILKAMNRGYTAKRYVKLVRDYRKAVPGGTISTDIIVGFPTETDRDFNKTYDIMKKIRFNGAFLFKYSPRPPAKASRLEDGVPKEVKEKRHAKLLELQRAIAKENKG